MNAATNLFNFLIANNYDDVTMLFDDDGIIVCGDDVAIKVFRHYVIATGTVSPSGSIRWHGEAKEENAGYAHKLFSVAQDAAIA